jgi:hypothetical protein
MLGAIFAVLVVHGAAAQEVCSDSYFADAVTRVNADCCAVSPPSPGTGHRRMQGVGTCSDVPRECASTLCARTYTDFFAKCESHLRESAAFGQYQTLNAECTTKARQRPEPHPEPEPEPLGAGCPPEFLGPGLGYMDVMELGTDGQCSLSIRSLAAVCSGAMFQTCIDYLHANDMGPGDRDDPDYEAKHPEPEPWGGGR